MCADVILNLFQDPDYTMNYFVYILTNKYHGTLYIGVTNNLQRRIFVHKSKVVYGFTKKYGLDKLIYVQSFDFIYDAITFEKRLKNWHRSWKINLIEKKNPKWEDLYEKYFVDPETSSG